MATEQRLRQRQWLYRFLGPTTLHLEHEFYLWISLSLLTLSTLRSLYRQALHGGDAVLVLIVSLWLSRHLVTRWLLTNDTSSYKDPTLVGVFMHWMTSHVLAGQCMDRPDPQIVAKNAGTPSDEASCLFASLLYTLHYIRVCIMYPFFKFRENSSPEEAAKSSSHHSRRRSSTAPASSSWRTSPYLKWVAWWNDHGPSIQMLLSIAVASLLIYDFVSQMFPSRAIAHTLRDDVDNIAPRGAYRALDPPKQYRLLLFLARTPLLLTLFWYGRIMLPIPDLVAGANVLTSVRAESLLHGQQNATSTSGKSSKVKQQIVKEDAPWAERFKSIAVENRFRLSCKVAGIRIVDALLACTVLPRTSLACRLTSHCPERPALWELSSILNPIGLTGPKPTSSSNMLHAVIPDRGALLIIMLSVIVISSLLLLAQAVVLNGSYLAIMGYISGEWTLVQDPPQYFEAPANWDPKRRYKKGDLIVHPGIGGGAVYRANTNHPEGRPFDLCLRATHDVFSSELGHSSTSRVIAIATRVQMALVGVIVCVLLGYWFMDYNTGGLWTALLANIVAAYGLTTVGMSDYRELDNVANEIRPVQKET